MEMTEKPADGAELDAYTRMLHLGLMVFGVLAWATSFFAGDYKRAVHPGFTVHSLLGMGLAVCLTLRLIYGFTGPATARFREWVPYTRERLRVVWEDLLGLAGIRLPQRATHQGLSGMVHAFGLLAYTWMASTGFLMYLFVHPGRRARGALHAIKEIHEAGDWAVMVFLCLHVGAVVLHSLQGDHVWRKMLFMKD